MNRAEIAELRGRCAPDKNHITLIRGCYVSDARTVISTFDSAPALLPEEELSKYLSLFRRALSGTLGQNLTDVEFTARQVMESDEHRLLMLLRSTALADEATVNEFYQQVIEHTAMEGNYLILLMRDTIPFRGKEDAPEMDETQLSYVVCALCPVKQTKQALSYVPQDQAFHSRGGDWVVGAPELGFLFPAFDDHAANIYGALYYTRELAEQHEDFYAAVFNTEIVMPPVEQKETFQAVLAEALSDDCNFDVVQSLHEQISAVIDEQKQDKSAPPPVVSRQEVKTMLESCGVPQARVDAFEQKYEQTFGANAALSAQNLVNEKKFEMRTPDVVIQVNPERSDLIETRMIDGRKYILILADEDVQVNGMKIKIGG